MVRSVLAGEPGPARDVVVLNAGAAILVAGGRGGPGAAVERGREAIDSGAARRVLDGLIELTDELAASP